MFALVAIKIDGYKAFSKHNTMKDAISSWCKLKQILPFTTIIIRDGESCYRYCMQEIESLIAEGV
jgi:hypothetical protein